MLSDLREDAERVRAFCTVERGFDRGALAAIAGWLVVSAALGLVAPYLVKIIVDEIVGKGRLALLAPVLGVGLAAYGLSAWTRFRGRMRAAEIGQESQYRLRNELYRHLQSLDVARHQTADLGDQIARAQYDTRGATKLVQNVLPTAVEFTVGVGGTGAILLYLAPRLTVLALVGLPAVAAVAYLFRDTVRPLARRTAELQGQVYGTTYEGLSSIEDIKVLGLEQTFRERLAREGAHLRDVETELAEERARLFPLVSFGIAVVRLTVLGVGGVWAMRGGLTVGTLVAYLYYISRSMQPIRRAPALVFGWYDVNAAFERLGGVLDRQSGVVEPQQPVEVPAGIPRLAFNQVEYAYPVDDGTEGGGRALTGLDLCVEPGERIVVLGPSGSGKSTAAKMIPRLFDPIDGEVMAEGVDLRDVSLRQWRHRIGYVAQEPALFRGTIRQNVTIGSEVAGEAAVESALERAGVDEIAAARADGLETVVGEDGERLSGGERKRVALARALLRDPSVLVLDQLAADLEERLCRRIFEGLARRDAWSIVYFGHRVPAGMDPDDVYWMERGRLRRRGADGQNRPRGEGRETAQFEEGGDR